VDGVGIVAILERKGNTGGAEGEAVAKGAVEILLQKQFRPPIGKVCIELPAGLIDAGESIEQCALRELEEETGYIGQVVPAQTSCVMFNDPGFCNTNLHYIYVTIDLDDPRNRTPQPKLEPNEFIECFTVPLRDLWQTCRDLEKDGYAIDARVGGLAEGFEIMRKWSHS